MISQLRTHLLQGLCVLGACLHFTSFAFADVNGTYELGPAVVNGDDYAIAVTIDFESDGGEEVVFFGVDLSDTDDSLTDDGDNYSRFEFVKNLDLVDWQQIPGTGFGDEPLQKAVEYDTITQPLKPGRHELGHLVFDASGLDASIFPATVSISTPGTTIGAQVPNDPPSFDFVQLEFGVATQLIPEPSGFSIAVIALGALALFRRRK